MSSHESLIYSLLLLSSIAVYEYAPHNCACVKQGDGHLGDFQFLAMMNKYATHMYKLMCTYIFNEMSSHYQIFYCIPFLHC